MNRRNLFKTALFVSVPIIFVSINKLLMDRKRRILKEFIASTKKPLTDEDKRVMIGMMLEIPEERDALVRAFPEPIRRTPSYCY
jgi:hypothetical protein